MGEIDMSDEKISTPSAEAVEPGFTAPTTADLSELIEKARASYEGTKASETEAQKQLKQIADILSNANALSEKLTDVRPKIDAAAAEVEAKRSAVNTQAQQVDAAQKRASEVRGDLDSVLASVKQSQTEAEGFKKSVEECNASTTATAANIVVSKATVDANAKAVAQALAESKAATANTKALADIAAELKQRVEEYEAKLNDLNEKCGAQLQAITDLLPGATGAGLAAAFNDRRETFVKPRVRWQWLFLGSVIALTVLAFISFLEVYHNATAMTYQQLLVLWLSRVPVAAALVWLAMHASRESALAKRLEEDYGFKVSVARSFQGFQEQMKNLGDAAKGNQPLQTLCNATLAQVSNPPGRIYDKQELIVSPTAEAIKALEVVTKALKDGHLPIKLG